MEYPYQRILLATQGMEFDAGAERVALDMAAAGRSRLIAVVPLFSNPVYESFAPEQEEASEADAAATLEWLRRAAQDKGIEYAAMARRGEEPYREIVDAAREHQADLIVLRRRGKRSFLANLLLGEMVHAVTSHAPCDVLIVPRGMQLWSHGIVLATDGSSHSDRATAVAAALAVCHGLPLTILSVAERARGQDGEATKANVAAATAAARAMGAGAAGRVVDVGRPYEAILEATTDAGADLIVVGRRGLGRLAHLLLGSTSQQVASRARCPVMIVQETGVPTAGQAAAGRK